MEPGSIVGLVVVVILLFLQGFLSMAKAAIMNLSQTRVNQLLEQGRPQARLIARLAEDSTNLLAAFKLWSVFISTFMAGIVLVTFHVPLYTALDAVVGLAFSTWLSLFIVCALTTSILMVVGHLAPEAVGMSHAESLAFQLARPVAALTRLASPFANLFVGVSNALARPMGGELLQRVPFVTEEEIMTMVDAGQEVGLIEADEKEMIYSVFALGDTLAREVMVPRIDVVALDVQVSLDEALDVIIGAGLSRIPVYEDTVDNVIGGLYAKDLLQVWRENREVVSLRDVLRSPYFVPESKPLDELLQDMQLHKVHMAIVVDEYGGTAGVVTIEDVVEELVGEIQDEYDSEEPFVEQTSDQEFIFNARVDLDDVNRLMGTAFHTDLYDTLGGFIYSQLGKVPAAGETIHFDGLIIQVLSVTGRRIRKVRVSWEQSEDKEHDGSDVT